MPRTKENALRIAMLGHKRIPSREGGIEIVVGELATRMAAMGFDVTCFNRRGHHVSGADFDEKKRTEYCGVTLKNVWTLDKKGLAAMTASVSAAVCAAFGKYDVVHFHAEGPCAMLWLPKLFRKKCIATIHGLDHQRAKWGKFASWYIRTGEKCAVKYADEIIVLSRGVQQYFRDTYNRDTVMIPNGITRPQLLQADQITKNYGLTKDSYILFLGRLVPEKGIHYLIEAYKKIKTDKKLVIAGGVSNSDSYGEELQAMAKGDSRILFTGFIQGKILEELYSNAYIYVLPSDLEGMPLSLLEAMSYGNCCVVSSIAECTEVVEDNAYIFEKGNVEALASCLQALCTDVDAVNKMKAASSFVCGKYNWDDVTSRTLELYR